MRLGAIKEVQSKYKFILTKINKMKSYYYVYNPNRQLPNNRHKTFEEAKIEAERLSLKHGCEIQILKCVAVSNVSAVSTILTEDEESKREPQYRIFDEGEEIQAGDEYQAASNNQPERE